MASIIQKKAAFATVTGSGSVSVTLASPISTGSTIVISGAVAQATASGSRVPPATVQDNLGNNFGSLTQNSSGDSFFANAYQLHATPVAGAQTYTLSFTAESFQSATTFLAGICIYELSGVPINLTGGSGSQSLTGFHKVSDLSASISGLSGGTYGNFIAAIAALTFSSSLSDAQAVTSGSGWTLDGSDAILSTNPVAIVFESQLVDPSGDPTATFSGNNNNTELDGTILIANYPLGSAISGGGSGGGGGSSSLPFLGSIRIVGSVPSNQKAIYLGHVHVVSNPPAGLNNPYLGNCVVLGSAPSGPPDISLGNVVIVSGPPAGFDGNDPFLGEITEI